MKNVGCFPDVVTYNTLINYFCRSGRMVLAFKNLHEMKKSGLKPNAVTYNTFINVFAKKGCYKKLSNSWTSQNETVAAKELESDSNSDGTSNELRPDLETRWTLARFNSIELG
uniref:Pentatricopeptide repeat-containing protein At2g02150 n=1 Tax=Nicotiana tabacum TaxID=4097 RepID=A0A1S4BTY7_TOBAC|nr:PREDICTED: putative pentatricopeptide repeat-containing protein At2g02150 [Nicotiana tabacum]